MLVLTMRTDKPEAEIGLFDDQAKLAYQTWQAHRELAHTIHTKIEALLHSQGKDWHDLQGLVVFKGPGSFTGLRIGVTVGATAGYALDIPVVGQTGESWIQDGIARLQTREHDEPLVPEYGAPVHITQQKK